VQSCPPVVLIYSILYSFSRYWQCSAALTPIYSSRHWTTPTTTDVALKYRDSDLVYNRFYYVTYLNRCCVLNEKIHHLHIRFTSSYTPSLKIQSLDARMTRVYIIKHVEQTFWERKQTLRTGRGQGRWLLNHTQRTDSCALRNFLQFQKPRTPQDKDSMKEHPLTYDKLLVQVTWQHFCYVLRRYRVRFSARRMTVSFTPPRKYWYSPLKQATLLLSDPLSQNSSSVYTSDSM
jgi:hypothetical protein